MSKTNIKVYALPTEKAIDGGILQSTHQPKEWRNYNPPLHGNKIKQVGFENSTKEWQPYHLYATTSETPKVGDWILCAGADGDGPITILKYTGKELGIAKVVATTDKDLLAKYGNDGEIYGKMKEGLPQLSPEFQQAWVREANNGTPIVDAMMEMEDYLTEELALKGSFTNYRPKFNPQGFVTILPVKEKMYTREEIVSAYKQG